MPRNAAGVYSLPLPPVVTGTTIAATFENTTDTDLAAEITNSLDRNGRGGMLAPFKIADGTVAAPGLAFTQDPDNGFYRIGADNWAAAVAGAQTLTFSVGRIDIAGSIYATGVTLTGGVQFNRAFANDGTAAAPTYTFSNENTLGFYRVGAGSVGVNGALATAGATGTVGQAAANAAKLGIASATVNDAAFISFNHAFSFAAYFGLDTDNQWKVGGWSYGAVSYKLLHEGNSFTIDGSGNLSAGAHNVTAANLTTGGAVNAGSVAAANISATAGIFISTPTSTAAPLQYWIGGQIRYDAVCAGDASTLSIRSFTDAGALQATMLLLERKASGYIRPGAHIIPQVDNSWQCGGSGARFTQIWASTGTIQTSDARQKKNIQSSELGLAFIDSLHPVSYQWIVGRNDVVGYDDKEQPIVVPVPGVRRHYGLIAQEVHQAVLASKVGDFGGYIQSDLANPDSELGLNYGEFIAPLIKAVQELSTRVQSLEGASLPTP